MALKKGLGKGLGALIEPAAQSTRPKNLEVDSQITPESEAISTLKEKHGVVSIDINKVEPNKDQPRKFFEQETLKELANSISEYGIIQPLLVKDEGSYFSIIAGERRWRAARIAGVSEVPAIIKDYNPAEVLQVALIENIQRQDLNPIEEAECFKRLRDDFFFNQEEIAAKISKSRNTVSLSLSLLNLDSRVQNFLSDGKLTVSHGKHLLQIEDGETQFEVSEHIIEQDLSVSQTTKYIKDLLNNKDSEKEVLEVKKTKENPYIHVEKQFEHILGTKVQIKKKKIEIEFYSEEELDRILCMIKKIEE